MKKELLWMLLFILPLYANAQDVVLESDTIASTETIAPADTTTSIVDKVEALPIKKPKFGYLSYSEVIRLMPEYLRSQERLNLLQKRYDEELMRADKEFNLKFAEFLDGQKDFPENILLKRQKELQDLMEKSIQFKKELKVLLEKARKEFCTPVEEKLNGIIAQIGQEIGFEYILNIDNNSYPFINKSSGMDITELVKHKLEAEQ
jgi:outer membrane protein